MAVSAINYLPPFANSLIMHVLTNAEKLIPLRDAASLAESRRLAGMRMVTGTMSPSTRYERISVSPASCSIKSEYVIASHAFKPQYKCINYTPAWEQRKLGDVADIKTGPFGTLLHAEDYVDNGIPIVTTEHFKTGVLPKDKEGIPQVSEEDAKRLEQYRAKEGDILFSRVGSVDANAQVFAGQDGWLFSGRVLRARPDLTLVSSAYLHYELETEEVKSSVISRAVGGTMASINTEILFQTPIFIPAKMTEQNKIGSTCARLDSLITLHQRKRQWLKWLDEGGEGTHHDIDILVFKFADDMKISVLCGVHACMTKSLGHTGNRYAGKQQQRGMGVP